MRCVMESYLGEIVLVAFSYAPTGWLKCQGQYLSMSEYPALHALIGIRYGGDGVTTFRLPALTAPTSMNYIICTSGVFPSRP